MIVPEESMVFDSCATRKINHVSTVRGLENSQDIRTVVVVDMKVNSNTAAPIIV